MAISDTSSITGLNAASAAASATTVSNDDTEQRFLKLLVTQLNNQDPLNPMENAELTSQLAQMSTVSGIQQLNSTLSGLVSQTGSNQVLQSASLIGYSVLSPSSELNVTADKATPFAVDMAGSASDVKVTITDASGRTVRTLDLGTQPQGVAGASWDGLDDAGNAVAAGTYQYAVAATNGGTAVDATALSFSTVAAVKQASGGVTLELASGRSIGLADVRMFL
ncbi:flagellar hook assembly protein FlgD [Variovorax sp. PBL-E5]|uniref:flagellar hook assembly protein FlgD n=1 Tax=Variovorax sp. PBL-E5 TaxID=434014 RepID=UPI001315E98B|nr:flagellar hook assembly protein FlgD [Variovorax sp. PBL-E5]VTU33520.1 Basal-body rod modification protein FlgD [Variovorax sp. PBL-E5]